MAGSALGGYASQPARFYPRFFSPDGLFGRYPYLLPNLIAAVCIFLAIIQASLFLEETNPRHNFEAACPEAEASDNEQDLIDERTPLQGRRKSAVDIIAPGKRRLSYVSGSTPIPNEPSFDVRRASFASIMSSKPEVHVVSLESALEDADEDIRSETSEVSAKVLTKPVIMWIAAIALMCYHQMAFISVFPVFLLDSPHQLNKLDLTGGLGFTVHDVGHYMAVNSCISLFIQAFVLPAFLGKFGVWKSILWLTLFCPIIDVAMPFITAVPKPGVAVYFAFALQAFCAIIIYPSLLITLKNVTPSRQALGKVNGLAVSASSGARTIAPPLIGIFYSTFGSAGAWWSCAIFAAFAITELCFVPRPKQNDEGTVTEESVSA